MRTLRCFPSEEKEPAICVGESWRATHCPLCCVDGVWVFDKSFSNSSNHSVLFQWLGCFANITGYDCFVMKKRLDDQYKRQLLEQRLAPSPYARKRKQPGPSDNYYCTIPKIYKTSQPLQNKDSDSNSSGDIPFYFKPFQRKGNSTSPVTPNHEESWTCFST